MPSKISHDPFERLRRELDRLPHLPDGSIPLPPELLARLVPGVEPGREPQGTDPSHVPNGGFRKISPHVHRAGDPSMLAVELPEMIVLEAVTNPQGILVDLVFRDVHPTFPRATGIPRERAIGQRITQLFGSTEVLDPYREAVAELLATGQPRQLEVYFAPLDKTYQVLLVPLSTNLMTALGFDISAQKEAEEALRRSEERFRISLDALLDGFAIYSAVRDPATGRITDFRYEYINPAGCRMNRRSREETVGHTLLELLPAHRETGIFDKYVQVVETGQGWIRENLVYEDTFGGERLRRVYDHQAVKMGDGFALTWREITDRVRAQEALREGEAHFRHLADAMPQLVWTAKPDGTVDYYNRRFREYQGIAPLEGNGWEWGPVLHPDDLVPTEAAWNNAVASGGIYQMEHRVHMAGGNYRWHLSRGVPARDSDGRIVRWYGTATDINDFKQVEEALRESEQRYRELFETMQEGLVMAEVITDETGEPVDYRYLDVNPVTERQFGLSREQFVGHTYTEVLPDADPEWIQNFGRVGLTGEPVSLERYSRFTGRWFHCTLYSPRPGQVVNILTDVTERKQTEEALRRSEEKYRQYFDQLQEAVMVFEAVRDDRGEVVDWVFADANQASLGILGLPSEQVVDKRIREVFGAEFVRRYEASYGRMLNIGDASFQEVAFLDRHFHVSVFRLDEDRVVSVGLDITERKQAEETLRASEARFRLALEEAPISVATMDRDLRYTWVYQPQGGIPPEQMLGKRDDELLPAEDMAELMALKQAVLDTGQGVRQELRLKTARGWRDFLYHLEPLRDAAGEVNGVRSAVLDITDQRVLEQEVVEHLTRVEVQHRLIEQREQERLQIARDLHDGPLQELLGTTYSLKSLVDSLQGRPEADDLQRILATIQTQINDLRAFTSELRPPLLATIGLGKAMAAYADTLQERLPGLRFHLELGEETPPLPERIRITLYRIYQEALTNVLKHAQASEVWVQIGMDDYTAMLEIRDNGIGFQLPNQWLELARQGHLGLVGMKERAEAVEGVLQIHSHPDQGTTLQVTVPVTGDAQLKPGRPSR